VRRAFERYRKLPPQVREKLRRKWQTLSIQERQERLKRLRERAQRRAR
jgi:hypothetical protein